MSVSLIDDYQRQLRILDALRQTSEQTRARLQASRQLYSDQITQAQSMGYMGDYVMQLLQRYREFSEKLDKMLEALLRGENEMGIQEERLRALIRDAQTTD